jgi:hypothetical protein
VLPRGTAWLPGIADILRLSAGAVGGEHDAASMMPRRPDFPQRGQQQEQQQQEEQQQQQQQQAPGGLRPVLVAMPDASDVNYYELRPVTLLDALTNAPLLLEPWPADLAAHLK